MHHRHSPLHAVDAAAHERHLLRELALIAGLGALLIGSWRAVGRTRQRRRDEASPRLPERVQTWEGEGGRPLPDPDGAQAPAAID
jgi:hypothetical protein